MDISTGITPLRNLYTVCKRYLDNAATGADIRSYGLTPELLEQCHTALTQLAPGAGETRTEEQRERLPHDLQDDGWVLHATGDGNWFAEHPSFNQRTGEYPMLDAVVNEARLLARPY